MREPLAMGTWRDPILAALHDQDRLAYLPWVKPPGGDVRHVVIDHPAQAALCGSPGDDSEPVPGTLKRGMIRRCEHFRVELGGREVDSQRRASCCGRTQLPSAGGSHSGEPIQPLRIVWSQSG